MHDAATRRPLAIDLYCGLGGWTEGLIEEGWDVVGFDNERHEYGEYGEVRYPGRLVIQDVRTLHGSQLAGADLIVASPPCTEYSYMAMPWKRAKRIAAALRGEGKFPPKYKGSRTVAELNALFDACFRIQREASEAAGRKVPLVVENVRGAQPWVGKAEWHYGSYYLWGDVPALMPIPRKRGVKVPGLNWSSEDKAKRGCFRDSAIKNSGGSWFRVAHNTTSGKGRNPDGRNPAHTPHMTNPAEHVKQPGISGPRANGKGDRWFQDGAAKHGGKSAKRKMASALIAKIPRALSRHIAQVYGGRVYGERVAASPAPKPAQ